MACWPRDGGGDSDGGGCLLGVGFAPLAGCFVGCFDACLPDCLADCLAGCLAFLALALAGVADKDEAAEDEDDDEEEGGGGGPMSASEACIAILSAMSCP